MRLHQSACWAYGLHLKGPHHPHDTPGLLLPRLWCPLPRILPLDVCMALSPSSDDHRASELLSSSSLVICRSAEGGLVCQKQVLMFLHSAVPPDATREVPLMVASCHGWLLPGLSHCHDHSVLLSHLPKGRTGPSLSLLQYSQHGAVSPNKIL